MGLTSHARLGVLFHRLIRTTDDVVRTARTRSKSEYHPRGGRPGAATRFTAFRRACDG